MILLLESLHADAEALLAAEGPLVRAAERRRRGAGDELGGMTLGIVGFGCIGKRVATLATVFGMEVIVAQHTTATPSATAGPSSRSAQTAPLRSALRERLALADIITLHVPLTAATQGLLGEAHLASMRSGALLINIAWGALVDMPALRESRASGHLGGFAAEVLDVASPATDEPLLALDNVILTPHVASLTAATYRALCMSTATNVGRVLMGEAPLPGSLFGEHGARRSRQYPKIGVAADSVTSLHSTIAVGRQTTKVLASVGVIAFHAESAWEYAVYGPPCRAHRPCHSVPNNMKNSRPANLVAWTACLSIQASAANLVALQCAPTEPVVACKAPAERTADGARGRQDGRPKKSRGVEKREFTSGVELDGKQIAFSELPADLPESVQRAIGLARPYCETHGGWLVIEPHKRLALVVQELDKQSRKWIELAVETADWFDERLPAVPSQSAPEPRGTWRSDVFKADSDMAVVFLLHDEAAQVALLERIAGHAPAVASLAQSLSAQPGFTLGQPLCAAVLLQVAGNEEWSAEHELLSRTAQLLLERRFGTQPCWIQQGVAWCAEWSHDRELYCFPYRDEFVARAEHGAWQNEIRRAFAKRTEQPVSAVELAACRRGHWDVDAARAAFGVADFLLSQEPVQAASALEALRAWRDLDDRQPTSERSWTRTPGYEIAAEKVDELLAKHLGGDWGTRATQHLALLGKRSGSSAARDAGGRSKGAGKKPAGR